MASGTGDSGGLPFLPREWLRHADGIARQSYGLASVADVPPEHRGLLLERVREIMEGQNVVPPENWQATLAQQCGWDQGNA